jgi:hypothetical protein
MQRDLMRDLRKGFLIACLMMTLLYPVVGEVQKLNFGTDSSWKVIDFENDGWTSEDYDDSWWEPALERSTSSNNWFGGKLVNRCIWYPGELTENTQYFRGSFDIPGSDIVYGIFDVGLRAKGTIELYLNDNSIGTVKANRDNPERLYIASYLHPGKNVIAAKVTIPKGSYFGWALDGLVRYNN